METTLSKIQKIFRIGKILSRIAYVLSIVGMICCVVGGLSIFGLEKYYSGEFTTYLVDFSQQTIANVYISIIIGFIMLISQFIIAKKSLEFFEYEMRVGTPFDMECANRLKQLGIYEIVVPIITVIIASIIYSVLLEVFGGSIDMNFDNVGTIGLGIVYIVVSFILRYGAEIKEGKNGSE